MSKAAPADRGPITAPAAPPAERLGALGLGGVEAGAGERGETAAQALRRWDEDRWLVSRFADKAARARLDALYVAANELARAADGVKEPLLAQMRLTWWRGSLEAMLEQRDAAQPPSVRALAACHAEVGFDRTAVLALADARITEIGEAPFETWADLDAYVDATAGGLIRLAMQAVDPSIQPSAQLQAFTKAAGRAWGYTGLLRAMTFWRQAGRSFFPRRFAQHVALNESEFRDNAQGHRPQAIVRALLDRAVGGYREAQRLASSAPANLFPAFGYVGLTPLYLRRLEREQAGDQPPPVLHRQAVLIWRSLRGGL